MPGGWKAQDKGGRETNQSSFWQKKGGLGKTIRKAYCSRLASLLSRLSASRFGPYNARKCVLRPATTPAIRDTRFDALRYLHLCRNSTDSESKQCAGFPDPFLNFLKNFDWIDEPHNKTQKGADVLRHRDAPIASRNFFFKFKFAVWPPTSIVAVSFLEDITHSVAGKYSLHNSSREWPRCALRAHCIGHM